jgi:hypothetical protein
VVPRNRLLLTQFTRGKKHLLTQCTHGKTFVDAFYARKKLFRETGICLRLSVRNIPETPVHMCILLWWRGQVGPSPPATEEIGAMGREIESRQSIPIPIWR